MWKGIFYIALIVALWYFLKWLFSYIGQRAGQHTAKIKSNNFEEKKSTKDFLRNSGPNITFAMMHESLSSKQIDSLVSEEFFLEHLIENASVKNLNEILKKTNIAQKIPLTHNLAILALEKEDPAYLEVLREAYGSSKFDAKMSDSLPYHCLMGNVEQVEGLVDKAMSGSIDSDSLNDKSLLWFSIQSKNPAIVKQVTRLGSDALSKEGGDDEFLLACEKGNEEIIDTIFKMKINRSNKDKSGTNYYAKLVTRNFAPEFLIKYANVLKSDGLSIDMNEYKNILEAKGIYNDVADILNLPHDVKAKVVSVVTNSKVANRIIMLKPYFKGLVGYGTFQSRLENDIGAWLSRDQKSRILLCWGVPGNGKTELSLRLAGFKSNLAANQDFSNTSYFTPSTVGGLGEVLKSPASSLVIIDDFHTIANPHTSVAYNESFHKNFLVTLKTIIGASNNYWLFMINHKSEIAPSREEVTRMFGEEIAGLVDVANWNLPRWGMSELVAYATAQEKMVQLLDDDGIARVVTRLHKKGLGAKEIEKLVQKVSNMASINKLDNTQIDQILDQIGA